MNDRPRLLFVSPRFLFPADSGGKIRTSEILRNLKGGAFSITLACPASPAQLSRHARELEQVADRLLTWPAQGAGPLARLLRAQHIFSRLPIPVATDRSEAGSRAVVAAMANEPAVVVFDFAHAAVLAPASLQSVASVLFTHNVEAEIFARHAAVARNPLLRWIWRGQHRKMLRFEGEALRRFDDVIAVSERDGAAFQRDYGCARVSVIPTGVNLDYFDYRGPGAGRGVVFIGSMDWLANIDAVEYLMDEVWPQVAATVPDARMTIIGRAPPAHLVNRARERNLNWTFTGRVDDVRPHAAEAAVCVIPLRIGGGTRIKAFEAMSMGLPVVSTSIGVEGLEIERDEHYLCADSASGLASSLIELLQSPSLGRELAERARAHVAAHFSNAVVGRRFEAICLQTLSARHPRATREMPPGAGVPGERPENHRLTQSSH